jgi:hypothetical protein
LCFKSLDPPALTYYSCRYESEGSEVYSEDDEEDDSELEEEEVVKPAKAGDAEAAGTSRTYLPLDISH